MMSQYVVEMRSIAIPDSALSQHIVLLLYVWFILSPSKGSETLAPA